MGLIFTFEEVKQIVLEVTKILSNKPNYRVNRLIDNDWNNEEIVQVVNERDFKYLKLGHTFEKIPL